MNHKEELVSRRFLQKNLKVIQIVFKWYRILKNRINLKLSKKNKNTFVDSYFNKANSINNTEIKEFPNALLNLHNLKKIYLNDNKIKKFPNLIFRLPNLEILSLEGNKIKMRPKDISKFVKNTFTVNNNVWTRKISI